MQVASESEPLVGRRSSQANGIHGVDPSFSLSSQRNSLINLGEDYEDDAMAKIARTYSMGHPVGQVPNADQVASRRSSSILAPKSLSVLALVGLTFFNVSGGAFGTEEIISSGGPLPGLIGKHVRVESGGCWPCTKYWY